MQPRDRPYLECALLYPEINIENVNEIDKVDIAHLTAIRDWRPRWISYYFKQYHESLLDVSCGNARNLQYYDWKGLKTTGTEFTDKLVANCIQKGFLCTKVNLDIEPLPFADNSFDIVTCTDVIEHLQYPQEATKELIRVAKDLVFITTPVNKSFFSPDHLHFWSPESLIEEVLNIEYPFVVMSFPTKPEDVSLKQRTFLVVIQKEGI